MKHHLVRACVLVLGLPCATGAQTQAGDRTLIEALQARIEALERRVEAMEREPARPVRAAETDPSPSGVAGPMPSPGAGAAGDDPAQAPPPQPVTGVQPAEPEYPALRLSGFSDLNFGATDQRGVKSGFNEGQFTLHMTSALSPSVTFFGELTFTARADAGTGSPSATGFNAEVERSIIRFDRGDRFKASFGRYHTPINWWNITYHHGQWLQTTIGRPEMTQFGGRFIPVHFVGGLVEGAFPAGGLNLNYKAGIGNGRGSVISRAGDAGDNNNHRAWVGNAFVKPDGLFGLQAGGAVYRDTLTLPGGRTFDEWITSGHLVWLKETPEVIAEIANVNHGERGRPGSQNSLGLYAQVGYRLPRFRLWKPYYRYERIRIARRDAVFQEVPELTASILGVRYDVSGLAAIKAEYRRVRRGAAQPAIDGGFLQTSFTF